MAKDQERPAGTPAEAQETDPEVIAEQQAARDLAPGHSGGDVVESRASYQFRQFLLRAATDPEEQKARAAAITNRQLDTILSSPQDDVKAILDSDAGGTYSTKDLIGLQLTILPGYTVAETWDEFDAPLGVYIQFSGVSLIDMPEAGIMAGSELLISSGAPLVQGKLVTLNNAGLCPVDVLISGVRSQKGEVIRLMRIPGRDYASA